MGDLSKNFSRSEYICRCGCGFDAVDVELIKVMQELRDHYQSPITITGGNRCCFYNNITLGAALQAEIVKLQELQTTVTEKSFDVVENKRTTVDPVKTGK